MDVPPIENAQPSILLVDDSAVARLHAEMMLSGAGYTNVTFAASAEEALSLLGVEGYRTPGDSGASGASGVGINDAGASGASGTPEAASPPNFDLILMDVVMLGMNGIEACRRIKREPSLKDVPVIVLTGESDISALANAFDAGAMDYITKPARELELQVRVRSALQLKREMDRRKAREQELEVLNARLHELSTRDGLTGIANRREFDARLEREFSRAAREGQPLSLLLVDVDHFKKYNDTYGHQAGDECLKQVGAVLGAIACRPADLPARYGGEEFVLLLPATPAAGALALGEQLRERISALQIPHSASLTAPHVSISVGVCTVRPDRQGLLTPAAVIAAADQALYRAKEEGRNRVVIGSAVASSASEIDAAVAAQVT